MRKKFKLMIANIGLFAVFVWFPLITSCSIVQQDLPLERVSLAKDACMNANSLLVPHLPLGVNDQIKAPSLAGGIIRSGDFLISLSLICDTSLDSDDPEKPAQPWQGYSEVRYLGIASGWEYVGNITNLEGLEIKKSITINGEPILFNNAGPQRSSSWGSGELHYSPINSENQIVARAIASGEPVDIVLTVTDSITTTAVRLTATFEETPYGYQLLSAEIMAK